MFAKVIPAGTYAVFIHRFSDGGFDHAFAAVRDWLAASAHAAAHPFDLQCYDERFTGPGDPQSVLENRVPVVPRKE